MTKTIKISGSLSLPLDAITNTFAIFGIRGAGKSNIGAVMAEGIIKAGQPVCIIDPTGAWYGLKSSADGRGPGLSVYVFGGEHADIPLEPTAGEVLANFVVERRVPVVLDLKLMRKYEQIRFMVAFAETLFHRNREPLMVFIDEAARFAPQTIKDKAPDAARCLGAMEDLATLGRTRGLGVTLMAQRPAPVSTTLRTQIENLICLRTIGKHDRKALDEWVEAKGTQEERDQMMKDLAELANGVGYFWSPGWLHKFVKVHFDRRETFDSGRTPKIGEKLLTPRAFAEIDKGQLSKEIQATIEKAKAEDPKTLRARIAELERELKKKAPAAAPVKSDQAAIERAAVQGGLQMVKQLGLEFKKVVTPARKAMDKAIYALRGAAAELEAALPPESIEMKATLDLPKASAVVRENRTTESRPVSTQVKPAHHTSRPEASANGNVHIPAGERAVLTACAQYPDGAGREQITILTGYKRSTRDAYIQRLRERGFVVATADAILATAEGVAALGPDFEPLPTGEALREYWLNRLPEGERKILEVLISPAVGAITRDQLEDFTGYKRSTRDAYIQRLKARKLVDITGRGELKASDVLFQ